MNPKAAAAIGSLPSPRSGHFGGSATLCGEAPKVRGRPMAEHRFLAICQHSAPPLAALTDPAMADRKNLSMNR